MHRVKTSPITQHLQAFHTHMFSTFIPSPVCNARCCCRRLRTRHFISPVSLFFQVELDEQRMSRAWKLSCSAYAAIHTTVVRIMFDDIVSFFCLAVTPAATVGFSGLSLRDFSREIPGLLGSVLTVVLRNGRVRCWTRQGCLAYLPARLQPPLDLME